jgi:C4-dicarboxylate-specific signal transduction histidine kinase
MNLVGNALDALEGRPDPRLTIRTAPTSGGCEIEVSDNGLGIDAANLARIFEPFFTTKPVGRGTGLGLSISRSLLREQGGELEASSIPGQGASFLIRLPGLGPVPASVERESARTTA